MATGHIRKRIGTNGATSYQITAEADRDPLTGKRERRYKTIKGTKKQAEAELRKMIADLESGNIVTPSAMKVEDWLAEWLSIYHPNIAESTRKGYKEKIKNYIIPALGNISLKALKTSNIQLMFNDMNDRQRAPKTIKNTFLILNSALKKAVTLGMLPRNPCEGIELPKMVKYQAQVYDQNEIKLALEAAKGKDIYILVLLALSVGLRRGELDGLKWKHINFDAQTISIRDTRVNGEREIIEKDPKSASGRRTISVGSNVINDLKEAKAQYDMNKATLGKRFHDLGFVICKKDGTPYSPDSLTQKWRRFEKKHDLKIIRLHDLRHSNATVLMAEGINAKVVQERLGHADVSTTLSYYTHVLPSMDQDAASKLDNILFN